MKITFRQGVARYQTDVGANPTFLQRSANSNTIDLIVSPDPTVIVFAHRDANYVFEEVKTVRNAWGPFSGNETRYLYWDVDLLTAQLTRGATLYPPIISALAPVNPIFDQHWFDVQEMVMKVWNGAKWIEKIRVFAATLSSNSIIKAPPGLPSSSNSWIGTQVGVVGEFETGNIVLDSFFKPLRQSDGSFVTSTTNMSVVSIGTRRVRFENDITSLLAEEQIPRYSLVQIKPGRRALLARSTDKWSRVSGIALEDMYQGETSIVVTGGLVRNELWDWPASSIGRPIFCGPTGQVTLIPAIFGVHQQVGYIYDTDAIYIEVQPAIMLDNPYDVETPEPPVVNPTLPTANFSVIVSERRGTAPHTVNFVNTSENATSYEWDFHNGGGIDSTALSPTYTYITPGTYSVSLKAYNAFGTDTEIKTGFIIVDPSGPAPTFTNLDISLTGPLQVQKNELFTVSVSISNAGLLTATNIERTIQLPDVTHSDGVRHQVVPSGLPPGATVTRQSNVTVVQLPPILSLISGGVVNISFSVQAPPVQSQINIVASVNSPENDSETGDNTTNLYVEVRS